MQPQSPSGLDVLPALQWGTHLSQFYETEDDLCDTLVPYFKAGLENNESCLWVTSAPFGANQARSALRAAVSDFDKREWRKQIEIRDAREWYASGQALRPEETVASLLQREQEALSQGYGGLRTSGNCAWVERDQWRDFQRYESQVQEAIRGRRMICMCSYCLERPQTNEIMDVVERHDFVLPRSRRSIEAKRNADENALRNTEAQLLTELAAVRELQRISTELIHEQDVSRLYGSLVDAAASLMRSDFATMQMLHPDRGEKGELQMLASRGFDPEAIKFWDWVRADSGCTCGIVLRTSQRAIATDVKTCDFMAGTPDQPALLEAGVHAAQSTPLLSRSGRLLGMISTHWRQPHSPSESDLQRFDILARLAADLIERKLNEDQMRLLGREAEHRTKNVLATVQATVRLTHADSLEAYKDAIEGRIRALANTHSLFAQSGWAGANLRSLVLQELLPYGRTRFEVEGKDLSLEPSTAQTIALCLHELTTNAAKYGALSVPDGRVRVEWSRSVDGRISLRWSEGGGPLVKRPTRQGFGTKMLETFMQMMGKMELDWCPEGLKCEINMPGTAAAGDLLALATDSPPSKTPDKRLVAANG
jgi:two-component sensor histidine kinase